MKNFLSKTMSVLLLFLLVQTAMAQTRVITGAVSDSKSGEKLPGVNVVVKGTTIGTVTAADGSYNLVLPKDATAIQFKMVGMRTKEVVLGAENVVNVTLDEDVLGLDEVVVSALGIKREKKALGYSVQDVKSDYLTQAQAPNALSGLSGKVAGVQITQSAGSPGAAAYIQIRGATSITGNNQPLFVVDGVPIDNSWNPSYDADEFADLGSVPQSNRALDINPEDIESISVLKGPAAAALYGINASNGVVIITTKKGSGVGKTSKRLNISYNTAVTWEKVNKLPEMQKKYSQGISGNYLAPSSTSGLRVYSWGADISTLKYMDSTYAYDKNGYIVPGTDPRGVREVTPYDAGDFFQTGVSYNNTVNLSGATEASSYRISLANLKSGGIIPLTDWNRTTLGLNFEQKLASNLTGGVTATYVNSGGTRPQQGSNVNGVMLGLLRTPPTFDNSNGVTDPTDKSAYELANGRQRNYRGGVGYDNPYWTVNKNKYKDEVNRLYGNFYFNYSPTNWLTLTSRTGTDHHTEYRKQVYSLYSSGQYGVGQVYEAGTDYTHFYQDITATATKDINEDLNLSVLLGNNIYSEKSRTLFLRGDGMNFPGFFNINNTQNVSLTSSEYMLRRVAIFGQARLAYKSYLFLDVTARNERSSTLPTANNSFTYPAVSLGFVFSDLLDLNNNKWFQYGKVRASYASVGKDADPYSLVTYYDKASAADGWTNGITFPFNGRSGYTLSFLAGNPNLKPENTSTIEFGTELKFLNNRLTIDYTYYSSKSKNLILPVSIAPSTGFSSYYTNAGEMENKGHELQIIGTPIKTKDFNWDIALNWSRNRNKVIQLAEGLDQLLLGGFTGGSVRAIPGLPYRTLYGGLYLRDDNGNIVINDDPNDEIGYPVADPIPGVMGDVNPKWIGSLANNFSFKGINLGILFETRQGNQIWNGTWGAMTNFGTSANTLNRGEEIVFTGVKGHLDANGNLVHYDANSNEVAGPGATNDKKALLDENWYTTNGGGFGNITEQFVEDGSFVKLRELSLGYSIDNKVLKSKVISGASIALIGRNIWLKTEYKGVDPETSLAGASNAQGMDYFNGPGTKSWGVNLKLNF